jgi:hypothetical protein
MRGLLARSPRQPQRSSRHTNMSNLPLELQQFAAILDAQPGPVQVAFQYAMCLLMVESGKMRLVETIPGESGPYCIFETIAGDRFSVAKPPMDKETEAGWVEQLKAILEDDEGD